jgi:hypothetical protein
MQPLPHLLNEKIAELGSFESQIEWVRNELGSRYEPESEIQIYYIINSLDSARVALINYQQELLIKGLKNASEKGN